MRYSLEFSRASKHREFDGDSSLKRPGAGITKHNMYSNRMQIFIFLLRATILDLQSQGEGSTGTMRYSGYVDILLLDV